MRQARELVPYAAFAVLIVGASIAALVLTTLSGPPPTERAASPGPTAAGATAARAATDLSTTGRLAYWRSEPTGDYLLWIANTDNTRRRSIARASRPGDITRTGWSSDGGSVAYVDGGVRLAVVRVDGVATSYTLAPELRGTGYRIVDHRSSPSGAKIAATVTRGNGTQSDVYVTDAGGTWVRLTTTEDVLVDGWLSEDELLVHTAGGIVGRLRATGRDQLVPLTGTPATTPIVGDDGRVHLLTGRIPGIAASSDPFFMYASSTAIWSLTVDGEDLRREPVNVGTDTLRLDGTWPGGAYLLHRGANPGQFVVGRSGPIDLPTSAGLIERVAVSADRRSALGFAGSNVVRLDLTAGGTVANATVLLGAAEQASAWSPRTIALAHGLAPRPDVGAARFAFALGGHLWTMGTDAEPTRLRSANGNGQAMLNAFLPPPAWSPSGDRVLTLEALAPGGSASQLVATTIARDGTARRYLTPSSVMPPLSWAPDGTRFAATGLTGPRSDPSVFTSELAISLIDAASGAVVRTIPGREASWTRAGVLVLSNGTFRAGENARDEQAIELWNDGSRERQVTTIAKLVADGRSRAPARTATQTSGLTAARDGAYAAVHLTFFAGGGSTATASQGTTFAIVRARDGAPTVMVAGDFVSDEAWAPSGRQIGYTRTVFQQGAVRVSAIVQDAETGEVLMEQDGRFAGWSPDGTTTYIARAEGLFARRLAGGEAVRFAPYGVIVSATMP